MQVTSNHKIELFTELSDQFPEKADEIIKAAQDICSANPGFSSVSEEEQADLIINAIFENQNLLGEGVYLFLELNSYLKKLSLNFISDEFLEEVKEINKNPFFNKDSVAKTTTENNKQEIIQLLELISKNIKNTAQLNLAINNELKVQIDFLNKINNNLTVSGSVQLKTDLQKNITKFTDFQANVSGIFKEITAKYKLVQEQLIKINSSEERQKSSAKIKLVEQEYKKIIAEQERMIKQSGEFQLLPITQIVSFPDLINEFSTYIMTYSTLKSLINSSQMNKYSPEELQSLIRIEESIINNSKLFIEKARYAFEKGLMDAKDKNTTFKNKFVEPNKDKFEPENLNVLISLIDSVF